MPNVLEFRQAYETAFVEHRSQLYWGAQPPDVPRTTSMQAFIYPTIGKILDMNFLYEHNKIDAIFFDKNTSIDGPFQEVPLTPLSNRSHITIEHENNAASIGTELHNFTVASYPLNVLITYVTSTKARDYWIFKKLEYQDYFQKLKGRLLIVVDEDMNESWNIGKRQLGDPLYWAFFFLDETGEWIHI
jgi:hypothetical protein